MDRKLRVAVVSAALAWSTAACGSTVAVTSQHQVGPLGGTSLGTEGEGAGSGLPGGQASASVRSGARLDDTGAGAPGIAGAPSAGGPESGGSSDPVLGSRAPLLLGFRYLNDAGPFVSAMGLQGVSSGDQAGFGKAVVDYINAHGGVTGRKVNLLYVGENATDATSNPETTQAASCQTLTTDNHVFAAVSPSFSGDAFRACMQKAGVPYVEDNYNFFDPTNKNTNKSYFNPSYPDSARAQRVLVSSLLQQAWLAPKPVIGIVAASYADRDRPVNALTAALKAHGFEVKDTERITPDSISSAVLKFSAAGVTHVFDIDGSGGLETEVFMQTAESQQYRPVYALTTQSGADFLRQNAPANQLKGAAGIGWMPTVDLGLQTYSKKDIDCLKIIRAAKVSVPDNTAARFALATCDVLFFFKAAMESTAQPATNGGQFVAAVEGLGKSYVPTGSFQSRFGRQRHDGTSAVRPLGYDEHCSCFKYRGPLFDAG